MYLPRDPLDQTIGFVSGTITRMFVDETGDHGTTGTATHQRYLGLCGVVFAHPAGHDQFADGLEALKREFFPEATSRPIVFHRKDMMHARGPFWPLRDVSVRRRFDARLLALIDGANFWAVAIAIDKGACREVSHWRMRHPYHVGLMLLMQRYCRRLQAFGNVGDILVEARGRSRNKGENKLLCEAYAHIWKQGSLFLPSDMVQGTLGPELLLETKEANLAGLQLADILAHPGMRESLREHGVPVNDLPPVTRQLRVQSGLASSA